MSVAQFRLHLREVLLAASTIACIVVCLAATSVALDIHAMRSAIITANIDLREGLFSRLDSALWKLDTLNDTQTAMAKNFARGLTDVRVQVQQASDDQAKAIKATQANTQKAVEQTITRTANAIEAAAPAPAAVNVEPARPVVSVAPSTVSVNPVLSTPARPPSIQPIERHRSFWNFLRWLWPFHRHAGKQ